jgi:murE/murF fusion protein
MTAALLRDPGEATRWLRSRVRGALCADSRSLGAGDGFIAWPGAATDGRRFVAQALARGAAACLVEAQGSEAYGFSGDTIAAYAGLKAATGPIAAAYYEQPSQRIDVLAVTGTNGKTSTAWWLAQALSRAGRRCGFIGTLGVGTPPELDPTGLTTPDPVRLQRELHAFAGRGFAACAIEASSIGIAERRLDGTRIAVAVFTNFTQDHLDYHGSMDLYWQAKAELFRWPGLRAAVVNVDDERGAALVAAGLGAPDVWTVSAAGASARLTAEDIAHDAQGLGFTAVEGAARVRLSTRLAGHYNVSNLLGVLGALRALGLSLGDAAAACAELDSVPGRMERLAAPGQPLAVIDYAHTPDALDKALAALRPLARRRGGALWCVFGCGGERDTAKRPMMAAVAENQADRVVVTSDNPRGEKPATIISQILLGLANPAAARVEADRARAIADTLAQARPEDVVLIAGKGHETWQEIGGERIAFSDRAHALDALGRRSGAAMMSLGQAQAWIAGARLAGDAATPILRVHTDTRTLAAGDLFVALKGERFDANRFLGDAKARGAAAAIAHGGLEAAGLAGLEVPDTLAALGALAAGWRGQFELPLVAVTGSNGKTTVTQMIAAILRAADGDDALATRGNFNNEIGVPLTLLRLRSHHRRAVVELGMNHPGEIARLAAIARPTIALVNNAQREHQEFMAGVEAVARENASVFAALPEGGTAVFPFGDAFTPLWRAIARDGAPRRVLTFGEHPEADVSLATAQWRHGAWRLTVRTPLGEVRCALRIAGRHNAVNALAAIACALAGGVGLDKIAAGLAAFEPVQGRSGATELRLADGRAITLIDDSYNANPDSMRAAIDVLASLPGPRLLVIGDMGEVGDQSPQFHAEIGAWARERGIETLFALGDASAHGISAYRAAAPALAGERGRAREPFGEARHFSDIDTLNAAVLARLPGVASVLVKGSRLMRMERVAQAIVASVSQQRQDREAGPC